MAQQIDIAVEVVDASTALVHVYGGLWMSALQQAAANLQQDAQGRQAWSAQLPLELVEQLVIAYVAQYGPLLCPVCADYQHPGHPCATLDEDEAERLPPAEAAAALRHHFDECEACRPPTGSPGQPCSVAVMLRGQLDA